MERNVFIIGKVSDTPQIIKNGDIMRIAFSVTENETGANVSVAADTSKEVFDRIRNGDTVEINGTAFTQKLTVGGKIMCQRSIWAHNFTILK